MVTKGIIVEIPDVDSNIYKVRVPIFEQPTTSEANKTEQNNLGSTILDATACVPPGLSFGYNINDVVYVGFENNKYQKAIILGKLYLTDQDTNQNNYYNISNLNVNGTATLPSNTKLGDYTLDDLNSLLVEVKLLKEKLTKEPGQIIPIIDLIGADSNED